MKKTAFFIIVFITCPIFAMEEVAVKQVPNILTIFDAAKHGDLDKILEFLNSGVSVNSKNERENTPLIYATWHDREEAVALLLKKGAEVKLLNRKKSNPLHFLTNNTKILELLLKAGGKDIIDDKNFYGSTPLKKASYVGHLKVVTKLLDAGANIDERDDAGCTSLMWAAQKGHKAVMIKLIQAGAEIDVKDNGDWTAFLRAVGVCQTDCANELLKRGADMHAKTKIGGSALIIAAHNGNIKMVIKLIECGININELAHDKMTALMCAAQKGYKSIVSNLVKAGATVTNKDEDSMTALMHAAQNGHKEIVELLIESGAESTQKALLLASEYDQREVVAYLLKKGIAIDAKNKKGRTSLFLACLYGHDELVSLLCDNEAEIDVRDIKKWTPLMAASYNGHISIIELLLKEGANVHQKNKDGKGCSDLARNTKVRSFLNKYKKNVELLVKYLDEELIDESTALIVEEPLVVNSRLFKDGTTPLMLASQRRSYEVCHELLKNGAKLDLKDKSGKTATDDLMKARLFVDLKELFNFS